MPRIESSCRGAALLEAIVALAVLVIAAVSSVALARQSLHAVERAVDADTQLRAASAFLDAVNLWPREELDRRLGDRPQGPWVLHIDRTTATLYRVALYEFTGGRPVLETTLFRPE